MGSLESASVCRLKFVTSKHGKFRICISLQSEIREIKTWEV